VFVLFSSSAAEGYRSKNFAIHSDLDPGYVEFVQANAEAYYENLRLRYFQTSWTEPLTVYYSESESETKQLLSASGYSGEGAYGHYVAGVPAIYAHRLMDNGDAGGWGGLYRGITHHLIEQTYPDGPVWFKEELASFFGEQSRIIRGRLAIGEPSPGRQILKEKIDGGHRPNIRRLFSASKERFRNWDIGSDFAQAFFNWLHETGHLRRYLKNVRGKGYELSVLEETVGKTFTKINVELLRFIKKSCSAEAYFQEGVNAEEQGRKEEAFLKALELKPDYEAARVELAKCYNRSGDYEQSRANLRQILNDPENSEYVRALSLMGSTYYSEKDYTEALEYYKKGWGYCDNYEYKYRVAYQIANCYYHLKDTKNAEHWYKKFLENNWEPERMQESVDYARKYVGSTEKKTGAKGGGRKGKY
jgi:hypothetical protein